MKKMKYQRSTPNAERRTRNAKSKKLNLNQRVPNNVFKFFTCCFVLLIGTAAAIAQSDKDEILKLKNFPFLYLLEGPLKNFNKQPAAFTTVRDRLERDAAEAIKNCNTVSCYSNALRFTDAEIALVGDELVHLVQTDATIRGLVRTFNVRRAYPLYSGEPDTSLVRKMWQTEVNGIAYILNTYIDGKKPLYPKIDSISFDKDDPGFRAGLKKSTSGILDNKFKTRPFYNVPLELALRALKLNGRDEAVRYEPLAKKQNWYAYQVSKKVKWDSFPYSAILVPGLGPEKPGVKLDPNGARRCDSAAVRYRAGKAPFIIVSGGHVHPNKTPYCEAIEMRKYLVKVLHIPYSAIIIEPHARHTTTNLRNANRLISGYIFPMEKPILIVSDAAQTNYINGGMKDKVMKELGYAPFKSIKRISETETEYVPSLNSWQVNSFDPLDP